jgi:hypothetical protein
MSPAPTPELPPDLLMPWWFDVLTFMPVVIGVLVIGYLWWQAASGTSFLKKQTDFLDHQKGVSGKALAQNRTFEDMIARQYAQTFSRSDRALSQSEEAIRLHAAALEQLSNMNETLRRLAELVEGGKPQAPA